MPKFTLPPLKKPKKDDKTDMPEVASGMDEYERCVDLPVNTAILDAVDTDESATVTLVGKIIRKEDITGKHKRQHITVMVESVEVYPDGNSGKSQKQFKKGFNNVRGKY